MVPIGVCFQPRFSTSRISHPNYNQGQCSKGWGIKLAKKANDGLYQPTKRLKKKNMIR